eukprot:15472694-Alexandrium_andersonii.AAC.1
MLDDWPRAASGPQRAGQVARLAETVKAAALPLLRGDLPEEEAWAGVQAISSQRSNGWPILAEFGVAGKGGSLIPLREPLENWGGNVAAVVAEKEHAEPLSSPLTGPPRLLRGRRRP